ncbi:MAG: cyclic nucleotide-binding and patatin-like phospholipase domain-containing protein, partial [Betaproteobacteria bacterium]
VLKGRLQVRIDLPAGGTVTVDEVGPGGVVGEMALLTGNVRSATVTAMEEADFAQLARVDFERLAALHPDALNEFLQRILPRLRRTQMIHALIELFGELDGAALAELETELEWVRLRGGDTLFKEGDHGQDVYIIVNGRLRASVLDGEGRTRVLEEVGRGAAVGELALLTGEPRAATIVAVRDSDLLKLSRASFDTMLDRHPRAMMQIARAAALRLRHSVQRPPRAVAPHAFAVIPAGPGVPLAAFTAKLTETLQVHGSVLRLGSADIDRLLAKPGISQSADNDVIHESVVAWLSAQEREHRFLVLEADAGWTAWTQRVLRQADRVLIVGRATDDPAPGAIENAATEMGFTARRELVLLQAEDCVQPSGTHAWLAPRQVATHHHVRLGRDEDVRRLARRVSGRAVGVVMGGGGARGFAHIGTLRALAESGVDVDLIGGASIGALIAAGHARGLTVDNFLELAGFFASRKKLLDHTLPITSLMAGRKVSALYQRLFGDLLIEDLWTPLFIMSSGLSRAHSVLHDRGSVWRAVRASTAIPAIFPPLLADDGEVLVDGGVMNNMPLDVMRTWCEGGTVIGLNPTPINDKMTPYHFGPSLTGWEALKGRMRLFGSRTRAPSIIGSVMRATEINSANRMRQPAFRGIADLLIEPPLDGFAILAFDKYAPIIDIGYKHSREAIAAWRSAGSASD